MKRIMHTHSEQQVSSLDELNLFLLKDLQKETQRSSKGTPDDTLELSLGVSEQETLSQTSLSDTSKQARVFGGC
jgi:hypothetical protein